jgi:hypothetical protein
MNQLNEGDYVFMTKSGLYVARLRVERVTKTQAILTTGLKLKREYSGDWIEDLGRDRFSTSDYRPDTEAARAEFQAALNLEKAKKLADKIVAVISKSPAALGIERLERIQAIIDETTTTQL